MNVENQVFLELLRQFHDELAQMLSLLEAEAESFKARDPAELERVAAEKKSVANSLNDLSARQSAALGAAGFSADRNGMEAFLNQAVQPAAEPLRELWAEILRLTAACKRQNEVNGAYLGLLGRYIETSLDILHGPSFGDGTYGPDGTKRRGKVSRRSYSV